MVYPRQDNFNSIKVRLKPSGEMARCSWYANFNSIKVRLKQNLHQLFDNQYEFQFHKGTIKTL